MSYPKILIVDNQETHLWFFKSAFDGIFDTIYFPDPLKALRSILSEKVKIVFISQHLSTMSGLEFLQRVKQKYPSMPCILFSENTSTNIVLETFRAGARDFIVLPVSEEYILRITKNIMQYLNFNIDSNEESSTLARRRPRFLSDSFFKKFGILFPLRKKHAKELFQKKLINSANIKKTNLPANQQTTILNKTGLTEDDDFTGNVDTKNPTVQMKVHFLGQFQIQINEQTIIDWPGKKSKELFAYLALHRNKRIYRDVLMEQFWPNSSPEAARNSLNVTIYSIRHLLHSFINKMEYIFYKDECYYLNPQSEIWIDTEEFRKLYQQGNIYEKNNLRDEALVAYEKSKQLYKGDFLEEFLYDKWTALERGNLKEIYIFILDKISKYYSLDGKPDIAVQLCDEILEKDNCREDIHRRIMLCYYRLGERGKSLQQFNKCKEILYSQFDVKPSIKTVELLNLIKEDSSSLNKLNFKS